jgi:prepilin-type processing-associated H-X9-DG protein
MVCSTHLRSQNQAAMLYAADHNGVIPRGQQLFVAPNGQAEIGMTYATCLLKYLGWDGNLGLECEGLNGTREFDVPGDATLLWKYYSANTYGGNWWWRVVSKVFMSVEQLQCPDFPVTEPVEGQWSFGSPLDYVASTFPIPYYYRNADWDAQGNMVWNQNGGHLSVPTNFEARYIASSKIEAFEPGLSPADFIYATEAHTSLPNKDVGSNQLGGPHFHHIFMGAHLPFAGEPRIANDERHPAGINGMFFDGHVRTLELHQIDPGYGAKYSRRLKWFTFVPPALDY